MSPEVRKKAKLLRKLKPNRRDENNVYDDWYKLCITIAKNEGLTRQLKDFLIACGIPKENLFWVDTYLA